MARFHFFLFFLVVVERKRKKNSGKSWEKSWLSESGVLYEAFRTSNSLTLSFLLL